MTNHYQPRKFFRHAPNNFLKQYFESKNLLDGFDFENLTSSKADLIFNEWLNLSELHRRDTESDFRKIDSLANEIGTRALLDEADWHGENLASLFDTLGGFYERAFWAFLERPIFWDGAIAFNHADSLPGSYWRKRKNILKQNAKVDLETIKKFEKALRLHFHSKEGRGNNCKVDCYRRGNLDYFFAYPEDYAQSSIEWIQNEFRRRPLNPAFEIIFVYCQEEGTLDISMRGSKEQLPDIQNIFAEIILDTKLEEVKKDDRIYDLGFVKSPNFSFIYGPESGISKVVINSLRMVMAGKGDRFTLETPPHSYEREIFKHYEKLISSYPLSDFLITQIGIHVTFVQNSKSKKASTKTFTISFPNSCALKYEGNDLIIRKMLMDSGIEPKKESLLALEAMGNA